MVGRVGTSNGILKVILKGAAEVPRGQKDSLLCRMSGVKQKGVNGDNPKLGSLDKQFFDGSGVFGFFDKVFLKFLVRQVSKVLVSQPVGIDRPNSTCFVRFHVLYRKECRNPKRIGPIKKSGGTPVVLEQRPPFIQGLFIWHMRADPVRVPLEFSRNIKTGQSDRDQRPLSLTLQFAYGSA